MKKKALIILLSLALTGCGSTNHVELSNPTAEPASTSKKTTSIETETSVENESTSVVDDSEEVEVILRILNFHLQKNMLLVCNPITQMAPIQFTMMIITVLLLPKKKL